MSSKRLSDDHAVELFRLRYMLRAAAEGGQPSRETAQALDSLLELSRRAGTHDLMYEHRRWAARLHSRVAKA